MKPLRTDNLKISHTQSKNRLEVGDIVTVNGKNYVAILNTPQILSGQLSCIGCAFVAMGEYHTFCGWPPLTPKLFHCEGAQSDPKHQILLRLVT